MVLQLTKIESVELKNLLDFVLETSQDDCEVLIRIANKLNKGGKKDVSNK